MTERELVGAMVTAALQGAHDMARPGYECFAPESKRIYVENRVFAVLDAADVRLTLPYRLTPPVKDGGWRILED